MNVGIDIESFYMGGSGKILGVIYVHSAEFSYPDQFWTDFVEILTWWAQAIISLQNPDKKTVKLLFMDGPYMIELTRLQGLEAQARFISRGQKGSTVDHEEVVNIQTFRESLKQAIQAVIEKCQKESWQKDQLVMEEVLKALNKLT